MRILFIINNLGMGGAERLVIDDINEMNSRGIDVTLITFKKEGNASLGKELEISPEQWRLIHFRGFLDVSAWTRVYKEIRAVKPDVVLTHLWFANVIGRISARVARVPKTITFEHGLYDEGGSWKMFLVDRILQFFTSKIVSVSTAFKHVLMNRGIVERKVVVIPNAIELDRYREAAPSGIREELGLGEAFIFLSVGSFRPNHKRMETLIRSFAAKELEGAVLIIAGDGAERPRLERVIEECDVRDRVHLLGNRSDIPSLLKSADCFVLLSRYEGFGIVVIEAMAAGTPVIVSDYEAASEIVQHEVDGLIVPGTDISEISAALKRIMIDGSIRERLASHAQHSVLRFSTARHVDRILALL